MFAASVNFDGSAMFYGAIPVILIFTFAVVYAVLKDFKDGRRSAQTDAPAGPLGAEAAADDLVADFEEARAVAGEGGAPGKRDATSGSGGGVEVEVETSREAIGRTVSTEVTAVTVVKQPIYSPSDFAHSTTMTVLLVSVSAFYVALGLVEIPSRQPVSARNGTIVVYFSDQPWGASGQLPLSSDPAFEPWRDPNSPSFNLQAGFTPDLVEAAVWFGAHAEPLESVLGARLTPREGATPEDVVRQIREQLPETSANGSPIGSLVFGHPVNKDSYQTDVVNVSTGETLRSWRTSSPLSFLRIRSALLEFFGLTPGAGADIGEEPEAYWLYLRARYHWSKRTLPSLLEAARLFRSAIEVDPKLISPDFRFDDRLLTDRTLSAPLQIRFERIARAVEGDTEWVTKIVSRFSYHSTLI